MHLNHGVVLYLPKVVSDYDFCPRKLKKYTLHYEQVLLTVSLESLLCTHLQGVHGALLYLSVIRL